MSVAPKWGFLKLPRELRDIIYTLYTQVDGGYAYNFATNQLVRADGGYTDNALILTCRQVAAEIQGLALTMNKITFRTYHSEETNEVAAHFHNSLSTAQGAKYRLLDAIAPRYLTVDMIQTIATEYPFSRPILDGWRSLPPLSLAEGEKIDGTIYWPRLSWGQPHSLWHEFIDFTLRILSTHPEFSDEPRPVRWLMWNQYDVRRLIDMKLPPPWAILTAEEAHKLQADVSSITGIHGYRHPYTIEPSPSKELKYTYSATSLAVRFLSSIPNTTKRHIRTIILEEDHESIANAPCHSQGLIPFCRENQDMIIKRNVDLWMACLYVHGPPNFMFYHACLVTRAIGSWMIETIRLPELGMPVHSFQLILDSGPLPGLAQRVFAALTHNATVQAATNLCYDRGRLARPSWKDRCTRRPYNWEDLPQVYQNFMAGKFSSLIYCNFHIDVGPDPEELVEAWQGLSDFDCYDRWVRFQPSLFFLEDPLPPIHLLRPRAASLAHYEIKGYFINLDI